MIVNSFMGPIKLLFELFLLSTQTLNSSAHEKQTMNTLEDIKGTEQQSNVNLLQSNV